MPPVGSYCMPDQLGTRCVNLGRWLSSVRVQPRTLAMHLAGTVAVALLSAVTACVLVLAFQDSSRWDTQVCL